MHQYTINASIQILPIVQDKHPYLWVDEAILVIQQSGLKYSIQEFNTVIEGKYDEVMQLINKVNEHLFNLGCTEWINSIQIQIRSKENITGDTKTKKFK